MNAHAPELKWIISMGDDAGSQPVPEPGCGAGTSGSSADCVCPVWSCASEVVDEVVISNRIRTKIFMG
jgi:hypothetical protein